MSAGSSFRCCATNSPTTVAMASSATAIGASEVASAPARGPAPSLRVADTGDDNHVGAGAPNGRLGRLGAGQRHRAGTAEAERPRDLGRGSAVARGVADCGAVLELTLIADRSLGEPIACQLILEPRG